MCPECFAVVLLSVRECPACGTQLSVERDDVEETPDELVEVTVDDVQRLEWQRLQALASLRGYKTGWAIHRFREKFGDAPSAAIRGSVSPVADPAEQKRAVYDALLAEEGGPPRASAWRRGGGQLRELCPLSRASRDSVRSRRRPVPPHLCRAPWSPTPGSASHRRQRSRERPGAAG